MIDRGNQIRDVDCQCLIFRCWGALNYSMKPSRKDTQPVPAFVERHGFYQDIMNYKDIASISLDAGQSQEFLESYERLKPSLGYVSYTDISKVLRVTPQQIMQHVKFLHVHSKEWVVHFSYNRNNENVFFKLVRRS